MKNKPSLRITQILRDLPIRRKLIISFFVLIFTPLGLLTFISYTNVAGIYEDQVHFSAQQSFDQAYTFLNYNFNTVINSSDVIYFDPSVQTILKKSQEESQEVVGQNADMLLLDRMLYNLKNYGGIYRAMLYVPDWLSYANQGINFGNLTEFQKTGLYRELSASKDKVSWEPPHEIICDNNRDMISVLSFYRKMKDLNQLDVNLGVLRISVPESEIVAILSKANMTKGGVVYLQDGDGNIVTSSSSDEMAALNIQPQKIQNLSTSEANWEKITLNHRDFLVISRNLQHTPWTMVTAIPNSEIFAQSNHIRSLMLILTMVIGMCAYGLAYLISRSTVNRLILLTGKMEEVQRGNLEVTVDSHSRDEIGKLMDSFNIMIRRTKALVQREFQASKAIKNYELKALQAQINPHFLYNTLDLINWKALDHDVPEIAQIVQSLAKFYKLSLNKGRDIVTVEDELNHIISYVQIQNFRFENRIHLILQVDPAAYHNKILKIVLQPLVENAIVHGILGSDSATGSIRISSRYDGPALVLLIQDDGVGMEPKIAQELLNPQLADTQKGYGVLNIDMRLKLYYGPEYGLTYVSQQGQGVLVEVRIPRDKP